MHDERPRRSQRSSSPDSCTYTAENVAQTLKLLGGAVLGDRASGSAIPADRRGCLLAYLASEGGWVDRNRLALLFWPDTEESMAKRNLRQLLLRVKRLPLEPLLEANDDALRWQVTCDVGEFRRALAAGDTEAAVALYRGPFMDGFAVHDVGGVDTWIASERDRLHAAYHGACMREAAALLSAGDFPRAAELLSRLLAMDPMAEDALDALVRALYLSGRRDAAVAAYERFAAGLATEMGLEPMDETRSLIELVRRGDPVAPPPAPETAGSRGFEHLLRPSRLAARDAEKRALRTVKAALVVVSGEPGVGKTALLKEVAPGALWCGATEGLERLPYHPLAALARARPDLAASLGPYREDLARLVPELAPELKPAPLEPQAAKGRLAEAFALLVKASGQPLVIDDLQWADAATLETLVYLANRGVKAFAAYRSGEASRELSETLGALRARGSLTEVPVEPLEEEAVRAMIGHLMGRAEGPPAFAKRLWHRSGGNPLFVLETLRSLFEAGILTADERGWHTPVDEVTVDYSELDVPLAVSEVIERRLARLEEPTVRVLEVAALSRSRWDSRLLARVTGLSLHAVARALDEANSTGFLSSGAFAHDVLRQAVEGRIPASTRQVLHAQLAEALGGDADPGVLAEHWWRAGEASRARVAWLQQAAAMRVGGLQVDAVAVLSAALARLPEGADAHWIALSLAEALREAGRPDEAIAHLEAVERAGPVAPALRFKTALVRAWLSLHHGSLEETHAILESVRYLNELVEDENLRLDYVILRSQVAKDQQQLDEAIAAIEPPLTRLRQAPASLRLVQFLTSLAALYDDTGRSEEALDLHLEALALAKALGSNYHQIDASLNLLFCYADLGRPREAVAVAEDALKLGDYDNVPILRINLAANLFQAGAFEEALVHYALLAEADSRPHLKLIALARSAECHAELGDTGQVGPLLDAALDAVSATDFAVSHGATAIAVYRFGDQQQVERLRALLPDLDAERLPPHQRERLKLAVDARRRN